jgi:hypothetical protein
MRKVILSAVLSALLLLCVGLSGCDDKGVGETGISLSEFNNISIGMNLTEVNDIIGGEGEKISEIDNSTDDYYEYIEVYKYYGETGGYAELEFTSHKDHNSFSFEKLLDLTSKTQYDLE